MNNGQPQLFKKWRRGKDSAGFASFTHWIAGDKVKVEIADVNPATDKINSLSSCYLDIGPFLSYLHAETYGIARRVYPNMVQSKYHGFVVYGGRKISRVFKSEDWAFKFDKPDDFEPSPVRRFTCGEYEIKQGSKTSEPDWSKKLSSNSIQMKPDEISQLYHALLISQQALVAGAYASGVDLDEYRKQFESKWEKPDVG